MQQDYFLSLSDKLLLQVGKLMYLPETLKVPDKSQSLYEGQIFS